MCKYCRDPSDVILGKKIFSSNCDCECKESDVVQGALGNQCEKCGCVERRKLNSI